MQIISADERLREQRGVKALIVGPAGVGKTSLLRTLGEEMRLAIASGTWASRCRASTGTSRRSSF